MISAHRLRALLREPSAHYLVGDVVAKGVSFLMFIVVAQHLGTSEFGWFSLFVTLSGLLAVLVGVGLPYTIVPFHFRQAPFAEVLGTTVVGMLAGALVLGGLVAALAPWLGPLLRVPPSLLRLAVLGGCAITLRTAWLASLRARKLSGAHARSQLAEAALFALAVGAALALAPPDHRALAAAYGGAIALVALPAFALWRRSPGLEVDLTLLPPLLRFGLPMVIHAFATTALATYDQVIVNQLVGPDATSQYAFAYRFGMSMVILGTAFSAAWVPEYLGLIRDPASHSLIRARAHRYVNAMIGVAVVLMVVLPPLVVLLGGAAFGGAARLVPVMVYANLWWVLYTLVVAHALHEGRTVPIAIASFSALLVNVGLNYLLIPRIGLMGAALASVGGYVALFVLQLSTHRSEIRHLRLAPLAARVALAGAIPLLLTLTLG